MNRYSMTIQWSDEDQLFLVTVPEVYWTGHNALYPWQNP